MDLIHTLYEPSGQGPHPAIVAFHGWGASALDLLGLAPYIADGRFMVICPQGPLEVPLGPIAGYGWFPIRMGTPPDPRQVEDAACTAARFIDAAVECYPVNRRKLALLGFSQGGVIAYRIGFSQPERFAALVGISTWFPDEARLSASAGGELQQLPTLVQHGRTDDMIEITRARESIERMRELRVPVTYREYDCGHEVSADGLHDLSQFLESKVLSPILTV